MATSSTFSTSDSNIKYNITVTETSVDAINNTSTVDVSVKVWRTDLNYSTSGTGTVTCTIDGTTYTAPITSSQIITHSGIVLFNRSVVITHNSDGSKAILVNAYIDHSRFTSTANGLRVVLSTIEPSTDIPYMNAVTSNYGYVTAGETVHLSWAAYSGAMLYEIQRTLDGTNWTQLTITANTTTTDSLTAADIEQSTNRTVKYRVRALRTYQSITGWTESNTLVISGGINIKVNNAWKNGIVWIKVNGSWVRAKSVWIKVNGTWKISK